MDEAARAKILPWVAIAAGLVAIVVSWPSPVRRRRCRPLLPGPGRRLLLVGDSLAVGLAKPFSAEASARGHVVQVSAKISTTMRYWLGQGGLGDVVASFRPDLVLVSLGTNDSRTNYTNEQLAHDIAGIVDVVRRSGARVAWILPPKLPFEDRVSALVRASGTPAFESAAEDIPQVDGIHPTGEGSAAWSKMIWAWLTCG